VKMNLPVHPLAIMGANRIFSVTMDDEKNFSESARMSDVATRIIALMARDTHVSAKLQSHYNLNVDCFEYSIFDIGKGEKVIAMGFEQAQSRWKDIESAMTMRSMLGTIKDEINKLR
jgi:hypothetical protein